jgi:FAD/FMN-containing dehydrogenase
MGHLARRHGFAADHVLSVGLVTADGDHRTVTADSDPDLFWALPGGQSSFAIVTELEFDLVSVPEFFGGALVFTGVAVEAVLRAWSRWAPTLPEQATTSVALEGETLLAPMREVAEPVLGGVGPMPYAAVDAIHMDPTEPMPAVTRGGLLRELAPETLDALLAVAGPEVDVPLAMVELRLMGGALARAAAVPNAVAGREGALSVTVVAPAPPPLADIAPTVASGSTLGAGLTVAGAR